MQLFGSDPDIMADIAKRMCEREFDIIDINMGCPVPKVVNNGEGSALLKDPLLVGKIVEKMAHAIDKPLTVKIRIGFDESCINAEEIAYIIQESGGAAVAVHGRTRSQYYSGKADWDIIKQVKDAVSVPVIGNGDVDSFRSCMEMYEQTGCDLVMIGRATYGNPFIFREIECGLEGIPYEMPTAEDRMKVMLYHIKMILDMSGRENEEHAMKEARKHASWYMKGLYGAAAFRAKCYSLSTYDDALRLADEFLKLQQEAVDTN